MIRRLKKRGHGVMMLFNLNPPPPTLSPAPPRCQTGFQLSDLWARRRQGEMASQVGAS